MAEYVLSAFADEGGTTLAEQICALKENGIGFIEPRTIDNRPILQLSEEELAEVKAKLDENGIKVNSLGSPIGKYDITAPFDEHLALFEKALRACEILGTDKMRMFSFFVDQKELATYKEEVIRRLNVMTELAAARGITLCHENESLIWGQMPGEVSELIDEVKGLAAIFDPANYRMNNGDVMEGIKATLKNLAYLHIKDAVYASQTILPAGEGEGRIGEILDIVNEATDKVVYLTLEPHLMDFFAYKSIDEHELRGKYSFENNRAAFDFAANALKKLLTEHGYKECNGIWKK
ncbi:MAG: sugar phosphate isomerase/epimerase [Clostridia bacterium]|nr:sugar phosphate isomerase/epimerase [Clostridia bacterium]